MPTNHFENIFLPLTNVSGGRIIYLRRTDDSGRASLLGQTFAVDRNWPNRLVRAEVALKDDRIRFYAFRRRAATPATSTPLLLLASRRKGKASPISTESLNGGHLRNGGVNFIGIYAAEGKKSLRDSVLLGVVGHCALKTLLHALVRSIRAIIQSSGASSLFSKWSLLQQLSPRKTEDVRRTTGGSASTSRRKSVPGALLDVGTV